MPDQGLIWNLSQNYSLRCMGEKLKEVYQERTISGFKYKTSTEQVESKEVIGSGSYFWENSNNSG